MAEKKQGRKRGNQTKYDPDIHPTLVRGLARSGYTSVEIAEKLQVSKSTLYKWRQKYPELRDSLKEGRDFADNMVEDALYKSALGFRRKTIKKRKTPQGVTIEEVQEDVPPNATAIIFWLKNRRPEQWRDKREVDVTADSDAKIKATLKKMGL